MEGMHIVGSAMLETGTDRSNFQRSSWGGDFIWWVLFTESI